MIHFLYASATEKKIFLAAVFLALFIFIPVYYFIGEKALSPGGGDTANHHALANNILQHGVFSIREEAPFTPSAREVPGYAFLLAISKYFFGNSVGIILIQIFSFGGLAVLTFRIAHYFLHDKQFALFTTALYILEWHTLFITLTVKNDILFTFFFIFSVYFFLEYIKKPRSQPLLVSCFLLGVSALFRPAGAIILPWYFLFGLLCMRRETMNPKYTSRKIFTLIIGISLFVLPLLPWSLRNYHYFGTFRLTPTDAYTLYIFPAKRIQALADGIPYYKPLVEKTEEMIRIFEQETGCTKFESWDSFGCNDWMVRRSLEIFRAHPFRFAEVVVLGSLNQLTKTQWNNPWIRWKILSSYTYPPATPLREIIHDFSLPLLTEQIHIRVSRGPAAVIAPFLLILGRIFWSTILLFAIIGARYLWKTRPTERLSLLLVVSFLLSYTLVHGLLLTSIDVSQRVNLPTYPFFLTLAMAGFIYIKNIKKTKETL